MDYGARLSRFTFLQQLKFINLLNLDMDDINNKFVELYKVNTLQRKLQIEYPESHLQLILTLISTTLSPHL